MNRLILLLATIFLALATASAPSSAARLGGGASATATATVSLAARLKVEANCWDSLIELQACTGEVIMFFLNGETYLGPTCCEAIRVIGQHCWPAMFGSIGFTAEEADVLQGFCDSAAEQPRSSPPPPPLYQPPVSPSPPTQPPIATQSVSP